MMDGLSVEVYGIRDDIAGMFTRDPVFALNRRTVLRSFTDLVRNAKSDVGAHPEHYGLWFLGTWHKVEGVFTPADAGKQFVVNGADLLAEEQG